MAPLAQTNLAGMGPAGQQVTAQDDNATMFVEVYYDLQAAGQASCARRRRPTFKEIASMTVRDRRDLTTRRPTNGVYGDRVDAADRDIIAARAARTAGPRLSGSSHLLHRRDDLGRR